MEKIKILGIDPSLRNTGLVILSYDSEKPLSKAFSVTNAQVLVNPQKYKAKDAILNMIDMLREQSEKEVYQDVKDVIIESPSVLFNQAWAGGTISSIAHISGACIPLFGIEKSYLFRPNEWNKSRKKDITHNQTLMTLGGVDKWHYEKQLKSDRFLEHILDAASMAFWWIKETYVEE